MCSSICTCMEFILWAAQLSSPKIPSIPFETRDLQFLGFLYPLMRDWVITQCHKQWLRVRTEPKESSHVQALKAGQRPRPRDLRRIFGQSGTTLPSPVLSRKAADSWTSLLEASASRFILTKVTHEFCHLFLFSLALPEFLWLFCTFIEGFKLSFKLWLTVTIIIF